MGSYAILVYGYNRNAAGMIQEYLSRVIKEPVRLFSATGQESKRVKQLLSDQVEEVFVDSSPKFVMFLGFSNDEIHNSLDQFHMVQDVDRPIFCGLTQDNMEWTIEELLDHLVKEHQHWSQQ
ncbi:MAG: DUF3783 domain-containing protein [Candidatus Thermoplasmatota archaeon]|nr:DUF3783 domain-containing protein [Candidatus Thermoplasmatota archaeon]MBU1941384.1 DUF3783 domain-containing protein [Candidatus Thermoplasmatota archaeon]